MDDNIGKITPPKKWNPYPPITVLVDYDWIIIELKTRLDNHYLVNLEEVIYVLKDLDREQKSQEKDQSSDQSPPE